MTQTMTIKMNIVTGSTTDSTRTDNVRNKRDLMFSYRTSRTRKTAVLCMTCGSYSWFLQQWNRGFRSYNKRHPYSQPANICHSFLAFTNWTNRPFSIDMPFFFLDPSALCSLKTLTCSVAHQNTNVQCRTPKDLNPHYTKFPPQKWYIK
jgi:hypothetical protein